MPPPPPLDRAFAALRAELGIRTEFPPDVLQEAERAARRDPAASPVYTDRTGIPFVTVDPPGSRDLDQAVHAERADGGYRVRYAIADVGFWVDRGGTIEREAWLRGVTFYAPDEREPLYPPVLGQGAASLLPEQLCPAVLFTLELDARAELREWSVERARVRSRAQLTYAELLAGADTPVSEHTGGETLRLLGEIGPLRSAREAERGGVSLPIREQHVERSAAARLGYRVIYEAPNAAEGWNAQISLLTGHVAALAMLRAGVGLLRTMPPPDPRSIPRLRAAAKGLGFRWPKRQSYAEFIHGLSPTAPKLDALVRQARRTLRGADYVAFDGAAPTHPRHWALAWEYAHATAPLRRLADRYVLDLLVELQAGGRPGEVEVATLRRLPPVMDEAERRSSRLERGVVDIAEAWSLRDCVGDTFAGIVIDTHGREVEVQIEDPPVRAVAENGHAARPLGDPVRVRLVAVEPEAGKMHFRVVGE